MLFNLNRPLLPDSASNGKLLIKRIKYRASHLKLGHCVFDLSLTFLKKVLQKEAQVGLF